MVSGRITHGRWRSGVAIATVTLICWAAGAPTTAQDQDENGGQTKPQSLLDTQSSVSDQPIDQSPLSASSPTAPMNSLNLLECCREIPCPCFEFDHRCSVSCCPTQPFRRFQRCRAIGRWKPAWRRRAGGFAGPGVSFCQQKCGKSVQNGQDKSTIRAVTLTFRGQ